MSDLISNTIPETSTAKSIKPKHHCHYRDTILVAYFMPVDSAYDLRERERERANTLKGLVLYHKTHCYAFATNQFLKARFCP